MNKDRVVEIVKVNSGRYGWRSWIASSKFALLAGLRSLYISDEVNLVLGAETYQYTIANKVSAPLQSFLEQIGSKGVTGAILRIGEAIDAAIGGAAAATFNPWFKHVKAWNNTEPLQLPLSFEFKLGQFGLWDAKQEVVLPILALLMPILPQEMDAITMIGPFQSATSLLSMVLKGTAVNLAGSGFDISESISSAILDEIDKSTYRISIGKQLLLDRAYCVDASVSLSTNVDQNGMPISGTIQLRYEGAIPPALVTKIKNSAGNYGRAVRFFNGY